MKRLKNDSFDITTFHQIRDMLNNVFLRKNKSLIHGPYILTVTSLVTINICKVHQPSSIHRTNEFVELHRTFLKKKA